MGKRTIRISPSVVYDTGKLIIDARGISVEFRYRTCIDGESIVYYKGFEDILVAELAIIMLARKEVRNV